jgi:RNase H-like domain found in reverse transcriptase
LGVLGYQRPFIRGFAQLAQPLTQLLKKDRKFEWTSECTTALDTLIKIVTSDPVLHRPNYDLPFTLEVDASQYTTGAILYQSNDKGRLCPVGYHSHTLNPVERGYDVHDRELLAVMRGLRQWQHLSRSGHRVDVQWQSRNAGVEKFNRTSKSQPTTSRAGSRLWQ